MRREDLLYLVNDLRHSRQRDVEIGFSMGMFSDPPGLWLSAGGCLCLAECKRGMRQARRIT